ncbi:hypothetical protein ACFU44_10325 [Nocardia rhizosphaerihabitans]
MQLHTEQPDAEAGEKDQNQRTDSPVPAPSTNSVVTKRRPVSNGD